MEAMLDFFKTLLSSEDIIRYGGITLLLIVVFAETGLFIGFFLPGDYLLFTAGLLCGTNDLNVDIYLLCSLVSAAAIAGNFTGYFTGKYFGPRLFKKDDGRFFKKKHLERTGKFYQKYGPATIIVARFLPIIRTFAPILAGAVNMSFPKFSYYNAAGCILWVWSLIPAGYFLGRTVPQIINYIEYFIIGFIVITTIPLVVSYIRIKKDGKREGGSVE